MNYFLRTKRFDGMSAPNSDNKSDDMEHDFSKR